MAKEMHSVALAHTATATTGPIRVSTQSALRGHIYHEGCSTLHELFSRSCSMYGDNTCLGERLIDSVGSATSYIFQSYSQVSERVTSLASGYLVNNLLPSSQGMLGIYMRNCSAWVVAEQACYAISATTVPLYDTLGIDSVQYIINHVALQSIVCSLAELRTLLQVKPQCPSLQHVILTATPSRALLDEAAALSLRLYDLEDIINSGKRLPIAMSPPSARDMCTICFTSGTTGPPKGAIITHGQLVAAVAGGMEAFIRVTHTDYYLSFLPLAHIFERLSVTAMLSAGASVGFSQGNPLLIIDDLKALQPTILCAVPRLLNRIYDKILLRAEGTDLASRFLKRAIRVKLDNLHRGVLSHSIYDPLLFTRIKTSLGMGRTKRLLCGGAPCSPAVMALFRVLLGGQCSCHEGYGQTETAGATTMTVEGDLTRGGFAHVGAPFPSIEIRLSSLPEMSYLHTDSWHEGKACCGRGEIQVRGAHVFEGYYMNAEETRAALTEDGWLRTGDVGLWTPQGQLAIIDRKKSIFKLSQGEYIAVEKLENIYSSAKLVAQMFIYGDSTEDSLVAVVVPDVEAVDAFLKSKGVQETFTSSTGSTAVELVKQQVLLELLEINKRHGLNGYEAIKNVWIENEPWLNTGPESILTPTMKLKRLQAKRKYDLILATLYSEIKQTTPRAKL